jgi:hypothetical protein
MPNPIQLNPTTTPLAPHLLDLVLALEREQITLTLVGGFGLILRQEYLKLTQQETLLERIPPARATEDFDVLLHLELLADLEKLTSLRNVFDVLGYQVVRNREHYQFCKSLDETRTVKIDLLTPQPDPRDPRFKVSGERVRPKDLSQQLRGSQPKKLPDLHARNTPEAFAIADSPLPLEIVGFSSSVQVVHGQIQIPHVYSFLLLKLFAFRDWETKREGDNQLQNSRKHARDVFSLIASLTQGEDDSLAGFVVRHGSHPLALEAAEMVRTLFGSANAVGVLRIQEGWERLALGEIQTFLETLQRTFPSLPHE